MRWPKRIVVGLDQSGRPHIEDMRATWNRIYVLAPLKKRKRAKRRAGR